MACGHQHLRHFAGSMATWCWNGTKCYDDIDVVCKP